MRGVGRMTSDEALTTISDAVISDAEVLQAAK
ncbi:hypothetical protein N24_1276 [Corynebacterium suranareeae]|uniref:Uncharacterized protein n=1 Tax=Corynebacterium suranareeae TaxID=2506452 RepID=A0A161JM64_9CORY|nr:hypothetical protein N24_1276 [Corynebacterium suranareeae]